MRRMLSIMVLLAGACGSDGPVAPDSPGARFRAEVETMFQGWFPLTPPPGGVFNACTGEHMLVSGDFHLIVRQVTSANGATHFRVHSQANVKGVGAVSGTAYVAMEVFTQTQQAGPDGAAVLNLTYPLLTVSKGARANVSGEIRMQMTVNALGETVVNRQEFNFDVCRGAA